MSRIYIPHYYTNTSLVLTNKKSPSLTLTFLPLPLPPTRSIHTLCMQCNIIMITLLLLTKIFLIKRDCAPSSTVNRCHTHNVVSHSNNTRENICHRYVVQCSHIMERGSPLVCPIEDDEILYWGHRVIINLRGLEWEIQIIGLNE